MYIGGASALLLGTLDNTSQFYWASVRVREVLNNPIQNNYVQNFAETNSKKLLGQLYTYESKQLKLIGIGSNKNGALRISAISFQVQTTDDCVKSRWIT